MAAWPLIKDRADCHFGKLREKLKLHKGSIRDPFFHLGAILLIFLTVLSFKAGAVFKSFLSERDFSFLASVSEVFSQSSDQLFVSLKEKKESPDLNLVADNSLKGVSSPLSISPQILGSLAGDSEYFFPESNSKDITEYIVQHGDNVPALAEKFGVSANTIYWANNLSKNSKLSVGQKLIILPVSGILYNVKNGDTLSEIAKTYKGKIEDVVSFNELSGEGDIFVGDILVIPGGVLSAKPKYSQSSSVPLANSYFIFPTKGRITQGIHWLNAVDIADDCGTPIFAAAQGEVLRTKLGYNFGGGNYLTILHPNNVITYYGHLQTILVSQGQQVSQGDIIALMGGKPGAPGAGKSTGCHLHFGVQGARNPFAR